MSLFASTEPGPLVTALGWALVHFIWQGALIAVALGAVLHGLRRRSANARYVACCAGLVLMAITVAAIVW